MKFPIETTDQWPELLQFLWDRLGDSVLAVTVWKWITGRRRHRVKASITIPFESLQTVSSMPDGVRARYDRHRNAQYMVAATATQNGSHLLPGRYQSA